MTNITFNEFKNLCGSCIIYTVLLVIFFIISISISSIFIFYWYLKKSNTHANPGTERVIY